MDLYLQNSKPKAGVGIIITQSNNVLLGRRKGPRGYGLYGLPGGFLEFNETFEHCAKRELFEETNLDGTPFLPLFLINGVYDDIHFIDLIFSAHYNNNVPLVTEPNRVENWEWFNLNKLPSPLFEPSKIALSAFVANYSLYKMNIFLNKLRRSKSASILYIEIKDY